VHIINFNDSTLKVLSTLPVLTIRCTSKEFPHTEEGSILPALFVSTGREKRGNFSISKIYFPEKGDLSLSRRDVTSAVLS